MPNNGIPEYFAGLRYIERKNQICYEGILKAQQNQEGDTDTAAVYLFLTKMRCRFSCCFSKLPKQRYTVDFPSVYGTSASLRYIERQQDQEGDTDIPFTVTLYRFMAHHTMLFLFCLDLEDVCFF